MLIICTHLVFMVFRIQSSVQKRYIVCILCHLCVFFLKICRLTRRIEPRNNMAKRKRKLVLRFGHRKFIHLFVKKALTLFSRCMTFDCDVLLNSKLDFKSNYLFLSSFDFDNTYSC